MTTLKSSILPKWEKKKHYVADLHHQVSPLTYSKSYDCSTGKKNQENSNLTKSESVENATLSSSKPTLPLENTIHCNNGNAKIIELCDQDKAKISKLIQQLVKLGSKHEKMVNEIDQERNGYSDHIEQLTVQNKSIMEETAKLRLKFGQSLQLLRKYQERLQEVQDLGKQEKEQTTACKQKAQEFQDQVKKLETFVLEQKKELERKGKEHYEKFRIQFKKIEKQHQEEKEKWIQKEKSMQNDLDETKKQKDQLLQLEKSTKELTSSFFSSSTTPRTPIANRETTAAHVPSETRTEKKHSFNRLQEESSLKTAPHCACQSPFKGKRDSKQSNNQQPTTSDESFNEFSQLENKILRDVLRKRKQNLKKTNQNQNHHHHQEHHQDHHQEHQEHHHQDHHQEHHHHQDIDLYSPMTKNSCTLEPQDKSFFQKRILGETKIRWYRNEKEQVLKRPVPLTSMYLQSPARCHRAMSIQESNWSPSSRFASPKNKSSFCTCLSKKNPLCCICHSNNNSSFSSQVSSSLSPLSPFQSGHFSPSSPSSPSSSSCLQNSTSCLQNINGKWKPSILMEKKTEKKTETDREKETSCMERKKLFNEKKQEYYDNSLLDVVDHLENDVSLNDSFCSQHYLDDDIDAIISLMTQNDTSISNPPPAFMKTRSTRSKQK